MKNLCDEINQVNFLKSCETKHYEVRGIGVSYFM